MLRQTTILLWILAGSTLAQLFRRGLCKQCPEINPNRIEAVSLNYTNNGLIRCYCGEEGKKVLDCNQSPPNPNFPYMGSNCTMSVMTDESNWLSCISALNSTILPNANNLLKVCAIASNALETLSDGTKPPLTTVLKSTPTLTETANQNNGNDASLSITIVGALVVVLLLILCIAIIYLIIENRSSDKNHRNESRSRDRIIVCNDEGSLIALLNNNQVNDGSPQYQQLLQSLATRAPKTSHRRAKESSTGDRRHSGPSQDRSNPRERNQKRSDNRNQGRIHRASFEKTLPTNNQGLAEVKAQKLAKTTTKNEIAEEWVAAQRVYTDPATPLKEYVKNQQDDVHQDINPTMISTMSESDLKRNTERLNEDVGPSDKKLGQDKRNYRPLLLSNSISVSLMPSQKEYHKYNRKTAKDLVRIFIFSDEGHPNNIINKLVQSYIPIGCSTKAVYSHTAFSDLEIDISEKDVIVTQEHLLDGWCLGVNKTTKKRGRYPLYCLKPMENLQILLVDCIFEGSIIKKETLALDIWVGNIILFFHLDVNELKEREAALYPIFDTLTGDEQCIVRGSASFQECMVPLLNHFGQTFWKDLNVKSL